MNADTKSQSKSPMKSQICVFLIDDHRSILWGLERLIESAQPAMRVVGSAANYTEALKTIDRIPPDVILLDIDLGGENGVDGIPKLLEKTQAKILVLTGVRDRDVHDKAVLAGASGVVEKEATAETILMAIARVHEGQIWLDRAATGRIFVEFSREGAAQAASPERARLDSLTAREKTIVAATTANAGATAKVIAAGLHISEHTLRNHLTSIYGKLNVDNRLELLSLMHKHGTPKRSE